MIAAWRSECGLVRRGMPAALAIRATLQDTQDWDGQWHGGGFVALADQVQDPVSAQDLAVVLDPHRCRLRGPASPLGVAISLLNLL